MKRAPVSVLWVPTSLGLTPNPGAPREPRGTWRAPGELRRLGLAPAVGAVSESEVSVMAYDPEPSPATGERNEAGLVDQTTKIARQVGQDLDAGRWPLVIGGDCSVLIGVGLALRRRGRSGLVFIDGHLDFRHPGNTRELRAAAGEDLAIVTGRGLPSYTDIDQLTPYFRDQDVIALGEREGAKATVDIHTSEIRVSNLKALRSSGMRAAAADALERQRAIGASGFWIHIDLDVLNSDVMPAVDSPQEDGLSFAELESLVRPLAADGLALGADVTIFDPALAPRGLAEQLVELIADCLGGAGEPTETGS
jgi:arginase